MKPNLITIGLTTFNSIDLVERAVQSALNQSWGSFEIIIVDDCSTDGTLEKLHSMRIKYPQLKVLSNDLNYGVAVSRNRILENSNGEFVAFFDDDDVSLPERLEEQYNRIISYEKEFASDAMVICHTARVVKYLNHERLERTMGVIDGKRAPAGLEVALHILLGRPLDGGGGACPTCCQMARLSTYRKLNGFDSRLRRSEDTDFNIRLALAGGHFVGISKPLVIQTMTKTSEKNLKEEFRNIIFIFNKYKYILSAFGDYEFSCMWLRAKYLFLEGNQFDFLILIIKLWFRYPVLLTRRVLNAIPSFALNIAYAKFHRNNFYE